MKVYIIKKTLVDNIGTYELVKEVHSDQESAEASLMELRASELFWDDPEDVTGYHMEEHVVIQR